MYSLSKYFQVTSIIFTLIFLRACGGGGGSSSPVAENPQAAAVTTSAESVLVKRGPASSVFVDGERFETDSEREIHKGEDVFTESELRIGNIRSDAE